METIYKKDCRSILVTDDNDDVRRAIANALRTDGHEVVEARNGKEALEKLPAMPGPVLILLDLMMPVMNGWEFLERYSKDPALKVNPVVTMSAVNPRQSLDEVEEVTAAAAAIQKPVTLRSLRVKVQEYCVPLSSGTQLGL